MWVNVSDYQKFQLLVTYSLLIKRRGIAPIQRSKLKHKIMWRLEKVSCLIPGRYAQNGATLKKHSQSLYYGTELCDSPITLIPSIRSQWLSSHLDCAATLCSCIIVSCHILGWLRQGVVSDNANYPLLILCSRHVEIPWHWQPRASAMTIC